MVKKRACACAGRLTTSCALSVFSCAGKKLQNNRGTSLEASQFFFKLLLALLVSHTGDPTNASADRFQYLIRAGVGWVSLASVPCLYASVNMLFGPQAVCLASLYRFHAVWAACKPFACFQAVQPAFKPFGPVYERDHFALYN